MTVGEKNLELNKKKKVNSIKNGLDENTFEIDGNDPAMQRKAQAIQNNSAIFDKENDTISIADESVYTKSDILKLMEKKFNPGKNLNPSKKNDGYMKSIKKADRELDYELNGPGWKAGDKPHKNQKKYDRKRDNNVDINETSEVTETVYTKEDINKMILEKKYNGKLYTKSQLIEMFKK